MLKKFIEGIVFGSGFTISFVAIWYVAAYLIYPMFVESQIEQATYKRLSNGKKIEPSVTSETNTFDESGIPFHELGLEEQIQKSSIIAMAKYEPSPDGQMKAIIKEFLKKDPNVTFYHKLGEEYPSSSYYPKDNTSYGDGVIIFFTGSPARMRMSMSYSGGFIRGLGDMPIELLREKCKVPNA